MANNLNNLEMTLYIDGRRRTTSGYDPGDIPLPGFMYARSNTPSRMTVFRTESQVQHFNNLTLHLSCAFDDLAAGYEDDDDDEVETIDDVSSTTATIGSDHSESGALATTTPGSHSHIITNKLTATTALISRMPNLEDLTILLDPADEILIDHLTREAVTVASPHDRIERKPAQSLVELLTNLRSKMLHEALQEVQLKSSVEVERVVSAAQAVIRLLADAAIENGFRESQITEVIGDEDRGRVLVRIVAYDEL